VNVFHNKDSIWDVMMMGELCLGWLLKTERKKVRRGWGSGRCRSNIPRLGYCSKNEWRRKGREQLEKLSSQIARFHHDNRLGCQMGVVLMAHGLVSFKRNEWTKA
jgi:hypothetical protein